MSKSKYEVWRGGRWIELTASLYEFAVNNNHYGRINGVLQHGDPEKKSSGIAAVGVAEYGETLYGFDGMSFGGEPESVYPPPQESQDNESIDEDTSIPPKETRRRT